MSIRAKKYAPPLGMGVKPATALLPGENVEEFEALYRHCVTDLRASGTLEEDIAATIAACVWRKRNLGIYRTAAVARRRHQEIFDEMVPKPSALRFPRIGEPTLETIKEATEAAQDVSRKRARQRHSIGRGR